MAEQKHILIVDDDVELGALLAKAVSDMSPSYTVKLARDVDEAMVQVRRSQTTVNVFDLVITDIKMTGLNGLELLEALHALAPDLKTIAMTAYTSSDIARRAEELNVQAYLTKPFMISEFRDVVRNTLDTPIQPRPAVEEQPPSTGPVPAQREEIVRALSSLRTMTTADATFLVRSDGVLIEADGLPEGKNPSDLGAELQTAGQAIAEQMTRLLDQNCALQRSFFGTETYSVCTYRVDGTYLAGVVFGPEVREGQVWYYLREAAGAISRALGNTPRRSRIRPRSDGSNVSAMLAQFFPGSEQRPFSAGLSGPDAKASPSREVQPAQAVDANTVQPDVPTPEPTVDEPADLTIVADIDWGAADGMSWDAILEDTDQGLGGLTFEEAQRQGLLDSLEGD